MPEYQVLRQEMFSNFDKMDAEFLAFLDVVLQGCGWFTKITSDYRDSTQQATQQAAGHGAAVKSLHELGRAVDLRMPWIINNDSKTLDLWKLGALTESLSMHRGGRSVEFEVDISPNDAHLHIGLYPVTDKRGFKLLPTCRHK